jgi:high-affinity Fe2+/Pb2+ permease
MAMWCFGIFFPVLVNCVEKNLATLGILRCDAGMRAGHSKMGQALKQQQQQQQQQQKQQQQQQQIINGESGRKQGPMLRFLKYFRERNRQENLAFWAHTVASFFLQKFYHSTRF